MKTTNHGYRETTKTCGGCGTTAMERLKQFPEEAQGLGACPHCGTDKCAACDMGDDVECGSCS